MAGKRILSQVQSQGVWANNVLVPDALGGSIIYMAQGQTRVLKPAAISCAYLIKRFGRQIILAKHVIWSNMLSFGEKK